MPSLAKACMPFARSNGHPRIANAYCQLENLKEWHYDLRVQEIEHSSFIPLVFSTTGWLGPAAVAFYNRLASCCQPNGTSRVLLYHWMAALPIIFLPPEDVHPRSQVLSAQVC